MFDNRGSTVFQFASICSVALHGSRCKSQASSPKKGWRPLAQGINVNNRAFCGKYAGLNVSQKVKDLAQLNVKHGTRRRREIVMTH
jgi:hypothetical protein